jgi:hypothetical protein
MTLKYHFPLRYKTKEIADGVTWLIDHWSEFKDEVLNGHELQLRELERKWRRKIGTLVKLQIKEDGTYDAEYDIECPEEEDGTTERITTEQFHKILAEANNNTE